MVAGDESGGADDAGDASGEVPVVPGDLLGGVSVLDDSSGKIPGETLAGTRDVGVGGRQAVDVGVDAIQDATRGGRGGLGRAGGGEDLATPTRIGDTGEIPVYVVAVTPRGAVGADQPGQP